MIDAICARCGREGHRASHCPWPTFLLMQPCMGGWCAQRDDCPHYFSERLQAPSERLCAPGRDGERVGWASIAHRPVGTWERGCAGLLAPASPFPEVA